ncbi:MAG: hypothetical protein Fur0022_00320 [Anaerolineales bacterium]
MLSVILASWLASVRRPKVVLPGSREGFFAWPIWAQIATGLGACVLIAYLGYLLWMPFPLTVSARVGMILRLLGLVFFVGGWSLVLWARWALGGMYGVSTSFAAPLQAQHRLIQHGPYAHIRHPMYLGYWLLLAGVTAMYRTWTPLLLLAMCAVSFYRRARREEAALENAFGAAWQAYQARTGRFLPRWNK